MRIKRVLLIAILCGVFAALAAAVALRMKRPARAPEQEVRPVRGPIRSLITTTGTILPKNRLEVRPPVNGRAEEILVKEGERVKAGAVLAWMSSTERAALIDAARGKSADSLAYWQETYKPIPLIAPIDAEVIVATTQPGQTITTAEAVVVLSDALIARAQVDETDISKVQRDQKAAISLDAYPQMKIEGTVGHLYYESKTVNNVTIYEVDVVPLDPPQLLRSGMNASIDFIVETKEDALLLPREAISRDKDGAWVLVRADGKEPQRSRIETGICDDKNCEIRSGLVETDTVLVRAKKYALPRSTTGTNPFMPSRPPR